MTKTRMVTVVVLSLYAVLGFAGSTTAPPVSDEVKTAIYAEGKPVDASWLKSRSTNADSLIALYQNESHIRHRLRLIQTLGNFSDIRTVNFLKERISPTENKIVRMNAIRALANSLNVQSVPVLQTLLGDTNPHIRVQTAETLLDLNTPEANASVQNFLSSEKVDWVSAKVRKHLADKQPLPPGIVHIIR